MSFSPRYSIVISVYNRPKQIKRCIDSCLRQTYTDFEVVVVDDCSTDDTVNVIKAFRDDRLRLVVHEVNRGMSWARRTGHEIARGQWVVRIDSDHALVPEALEQLDLVCSQISEDIGVVGACYRWDTGQITPPFYPAGAFDYEKRLQWSEQHGDEDYVHCTRRAVFLKTQWPARAASTSGLMELNIAKNWKTIILSDVLGIQFTDAINSYHRANRDKKFSQRMSDSAELAMTFNELLEAHGDALRLYAPRRYGQYLLMSSFYSFLAGNRKRGWTHGWEYLRRRPLALEGWGVVLSGLIGGSAMRQAYMLVPYFRKFWAMKVQLRRED